MNNNNFNKIRKIKKGQQMASIIIIRPLFQTKCLLSLICKPSVYYSANRFPGYLFSNIFS